MNSTTHDAPGGNSMTKTHVAPIANYTDAIANLPQEAFLGSLIYFSISGADVNLENAHRDLGSAGLSTNGLRKNLRPVDAFRKATNEFKHRFSESAQGIRSELMVRSVGEDGLQAYRHLVLERTVVQKGKRRRLFYDKVGELTFTRGAKKNGEYEGHGVEARRMTNNIASPLTLEEDQWLTEKLITFQDRYNHLLRYMDSHAVRTFVREYIYDLSGICVKGSGGLYFVSQQHADEIAKLGAWVRSVGSEFHSLPLLNLTEQREMILEAFEEETIEEVGRLMTEVSKILSDPDRSIEEKTFDAYALRAAELKQKVVEYNGMLGARADRAAIELDLYGQQVMSLVTRIRQSKTTKAKAIPA
jgi:hypothetical protein